MATMEELVRNGKTFMKKFPSNNFDAAVRTLLSSEDLLEELKSIANDCFLIADISKRKECLAVLDKLGITDLMLRCAIDVSANKSFLKRTQSNVNYEAVEDLVFLSLLNWTYASYQVCQTLIKKGNAIPFLISQMRRIKTARLSEKASTSIGQEGDDDEGDFGLASMYETDSEDILTIHSINLLGIVLNLAKHPESRRQFKENGIVTVLQGLIKHRDQTVQTLAMCSMATLVDVTPRAAELVDKCQLIPKLANCLKIALADKGEHVYSGILAEELAEALRHLAINDMNHEPIIRQRAVNLFVKMLEEGDEIEQERAIDCLWALSFNTTIKQEMKGIEKRLMEIAAGAQNNDLRMKAKMAQVVLVQVGSRAGSQSSVEKVDCTFDIFISYAKSNRELVLYVRNFLVKKGLNVWIDIDQPFCNREGSIYAGIDQSKMALLCLSESYLRSSRCRSEAQYLLKQDKPIVAIDMEQNYEPTGWLLNVVKKCDSRRLDFSLQMHKFTPQSGELFKQLKAKLPKNLTNAIAEGGGGQAGSQSDRTGYYHCPCCNTEMLLVPFGSVSNPLINHHEVSKQVESWSQVDVNKWIISIGFPESTLANFDGKALISIFNLRDCVSLFSCFSFICLLLNSIFRILKLSNIVC